MLGVGRDTSLQQTQFAKATSFFKENSTALITGLALFAISLVVTAFCVHNQSVAQVMGSNLTQIGYTYYMVAIPLACVVSAAVTALMLYWKAAKQASETVPFMGMAVTRPPVTVPPATFHGVASSLNAVHAPIMPLGEAVAMVPVGGPPPALIDPATPLMAEAAASAPAAAFTGAVAAMSGVCTAIAVKVGDKVVRGATLVVLEAMKMEMTLRAPKSGTVVEILVSPNSLVEAGAPLVRIE